MTCRTQQTSRDEVECLYRERHNREAACDVHIADFEPVKAEACWCLEDRGMRIATCMHARSLIASESSPIPVLDCSVIQTSLLVEVFNYWTDLLAKWTQRVGHTTYRSPSATHPRVEGFLCTVGGRVGVADIASPQGVVPIHNVPGGCRAVQAGLQPGDLHKGTVDHWVRGKADLLP